MINDKINQVLLNSHFFFYVQYLCEDECLAEILNNNQCLGSVRCLQIMSVEQTSHGYHLTHK